MKPPTDADIRLVADAITSLLRVGQPELHEAVRDATAQNAVAKIRRERQVNSFWQDRA